MRKFLARLKNLFHIDTVWIDKGQGRWVKRRRCHPAMSIALAALALSAAAAWGLFLYRVYRAPSGVAPSGVASSDAAPPAEETDGPLETAFIEAGDVRPDPSADVSSPGPLPAGLSVKDGEYWIRIKKGFFRLYLYRGGEIEKSYAIAVGKFSGDKRRAGDHRTPNGLFTVQSIENSIHWTHDFRDGKGDIRGAYGPWFIRLRTGWQGIGIHGTHDPDSRGSMVSEGCVRMMNEDLEELKRYAFKGMEVAIEE
jgi:lipoprotein-anchoring transpeptidase ErfK/SrfK